MYRPASAKASAFSGGGNAYWIRPFLNTDPAAAPLSRPTAPGHLPRSSMGIAFRHIPEHDLLVTVWDGRITADIWHTHLTARMADSDWPPAHRMLIDLSTADLDALSRDDVLDGATLFHTRPEITLGRRIALCAPTNSRLADQFATEVGHDGGSLIVFNSLAVACVYLGIDLEVVTNYVRELRTELRNI